MVEVKKLDTVYFYFSANEYQKKNIYEDNNVNDSLIIYAYYKDDKELIRLKYSKYEDFDSMFAGIKTYKKYHKKRFLKRNKDKLITIEFLNKLDSKQRDEFLGARRWKKNFIIDEAETKGRKVLIRRAFVNSDYNTNDVDEFKIFRTRNIIPFYKEYQFDDNFYTFLLPKLTLISEKEDLYILFEQSNGVVKEDINNSGVQRIKEQYNFKLNIKNHVVFFQLTHKRNATSILDKKYDLFKKSYETISPNDLNNFSEKELERLFARTRNIYIVEDFTKNDFVIPKLVMPTSELVDFVKNNND
ncbi:hypothetical protein [Kordia sp.]|uniref:hypothetical protein n=1 Tax=Kordia sp. TaxID=1965332 RepID=UPI003D2C191F